MIEYRKVITRQMLRNEPDKLFVFGDNIQRRGMGGQAKEMRGEPNAVGIPTKYEPSMRPIAFFSDCKGCHDDFNISAFDDIQRLKDHHAKGGVIVWPSDGIGTGLADLPNKAPMLFQKIEKLRLWFEKDK